MLLGGRATWQPPLALFGREHAARPTLLRKKDAGDRYRRNTSKRDGNQQQTKPSVTSPSSARERGCLATAVCVHRRSLCCTFKSRLAPPNITYTTLHLSSREYGNGTLQYQDAYSVRQPTTHRGVDRYLRSAAVFSCRNTQSNGGGASCAISRGALDRNTEGVEPSCRPPMRHRREIRDHHAVCCHLAARSALSTCEAI